MNFRHNGFWFGVALSLPSILTFSAPVLAQGEVPPAEAPPAAAPATDAPATAAPSAEAPPPAEAPPAEVPPAASSDAPAPPAGEASAGGALSLSTKGPALQADAEGSASGAEPAPAGNATGTSDEREHAVSLVGVEQLPGSAYPSVQVRGIKYGSLWRSFHGQQWPYMPQIGKKPGMRLGFSGYIWNDLSNSRITVDKNLKGAGLNDQNRWNTQTRGILRVTPTYNAGDDWFVQGNAETVIQGDMRPDTDLGALGTTDDVSVRIGKWNVFDVTFGRFQGWEIANHYGMALDQNTLERSGALIVSGNTAPTPEGYGLTYFWERQNYLLGAYALHVYPTKYLRGELLGHVGAGNSRNAGNPYQMDIRPSAIFDMGWVKVKAGWEYGKASPQDATSKLGETKNGFGFAAQFVLDPYVEFGGNFARGFQDVVDKDDNADLAGSNTVQTVGAFLNASPGYEPLVFGFGGYLNHWEDMRTDSNAGSHQGKVDTNDQWLIYGAAQYTLWDSVNLKFVVSHASNKVEHYNYGTYVNNSLGGRFRVEVLF